MFYSMHNGTAPEYLCDLLPPLVGQLSNYNLRNNLDYVIPNFRLESTRRSFIPATAAEWNRMSPEIRNSRNINIFKSKIKTVTSKPPVYFNHGVRALNIIHTRLRNMSSCLNADLHRANLKSNPSCECGHPCEDCIHFLWNVHFIMKIG